LHPSGVAKSSTSFGWGKGGKSPLLVAGIKKESKRSEKVFIERLYTAFSLNVLRHGSHSFTRKLHHACLSFVSVHQMAPLNVMANI